MCGGRGTRFDADVEKPLFPIAGRPMVDRVRDALDGSRVDTVRAVVSDHAPATRRHLADLPTIETPGAGYVEDLDAALNRVEPPVLTAAADLPLLDADAVDGVLRAREAGAVAVYVPAAVKRRLGVSVGETLEERGGELAPAGVNVVADGAEVRHVTEDVRLAVNVNTRADARVAEAHG